MRYSLHTAVRVNQWQGVNHTNDEHGHISSPTHRMWGAEESYRMYTVRNTLHPIGANNEGEEKKKNGSIRQLNQLKVARNIEDNKRPTIRQTNEINTEVSSNCT